MVDHVHEQNYYLARILRDACVIFPRIPLLARFLPAASGQTYLRQIKGNSRLVVE